MDGNLPKVNKESIFDKITKWMKKMFSKNDTAKNKYVSAEEPKMAESTEAEASQKEKQHSELTTKEKREQFKQSLKALDKSNNENILALQQKLKSKEIQISDLTNEELDEMIGLYDKQIKDKKEKLMGMENDK